MICPECGYPWARYVQRREDFVKSGGKRDKGNRKRFKRTDFTAECRRCGWKGPIY